MWLKKLVYPQSPLNWNCVQTFTVQLGIFADWCLFVSIKGRITNSSKYAQKLLFIKSVYVQCESFPPRDAGVTIRSPYNIRISVVFLTSWRGFNMLRGLCLSLSPAFCYPIERVSCCLWLSGFVFLINAVEEHLERSLCPRTSNSNNGGWRLLRVGAGRFLACLQLSQHSSFT